MKKYKPKKWFIYTRLIGVFALVFLASKTTNVVYSELIVNNNNEDKYLSQNVITDNKEEIYVSENPVLTEYLSLPEKGFEVTIDNKKYDVGDDFNLLVAVLASESNVYKDDMLAVMSVILNRSDAQNKSPIEIITAPGQFSGYLGGGYLKYLNSDGSINMKIKNMSTIIKVVNDSLDGVRNNKYHSFRSSWMKSFSDNQIAEKGNRFK